MRPAKVLVNFKSMSDSKLLAKSTFIGDSMDGNSYFPKPTPSIATLLAAIKSYSVALNGASSRDAVKVAIKSEKRNALILTLTSLANYINMHGANNLPALMSTGYDVTSTSATTQPLGTPQNFMVEVGKTSGVATVSVSKLPGSQSFLFLYTLVSNTTGTWMYHMSKFETFDIPGLAPLGAYQFQIAILRKDDTVVTTDIIVKTVV